MMRKITSIIVFAVCISLCCLCFSACTSVNTVQSNVANDGESNENDVPPLSNPPICDNQNPSTNQVYNIDIVAGEENWIFDEDITIMPPNDAKTEYLSQPMPSRIKLGTCEIDAELISIDRYDDNSLRSLYLSKDKRTVYKISQPGECYSVIAQPGFVLSNFVSESISEEALIVHAKEYISRYLDIASVNDYNLAIETKIIVVKPNAAWKESKPGFYTVNDETEEVVSYQVEYRQHYLDYPTSNSITLLFDKLGNITDFYVTHHDIDWGVLYYDEGTVYQSVIGYLEQNMCDEYQLLSCEINSRYLIYDYNNSQVKLSLTTTLLLLKDNMEVAVLCSMVISQK